MQRCLRSRGQQQPLAVQQEPPPAVFQLRETSGVAISFSELSRLTRSSSNSSSGDNGSSNSKAGDNSSSSKAGDNSSSSKAGDSSSTSKGGNSRSSSKGGDSSSSKGGDSIRDCKCLCSSSLSSCRGTSCVCLLSDTKENGSSDCCSPAAVGVGELRCVFSAPETCCFIFNEKQQQQLSLHQDGRQQGGQQQQGLQQHEQGLQQQYLQQQQHVEGEGPHQLQCKEQQEQQLQQRKEEQQRLHDEHRHKKQQQEQEQEQHLEEQQKECMQQEGQKEINNASAVEEVCGKGPDGVYWHRRLVSSNHSSTSSSREACEALSNMRRRMIMTETAVGRDVERSSTRESKEGRAEEQETAEAKVRVLQAEGVRVLQEEERASQRARGEERLQEVAGTCTKKQIREQESIDDGGKWASFVAEWERDLTEEEEEKTENTGGVKDRSSVTTTDKQLLSNSVFSSFSFSQLLFKPCIRRATVYGLRQLLLQLLQLQRQIYISSCLDPTQRITHHLSQGQLKAERHSVRTADGYQIFFYRLRKVNAYCCCCCSFSKLVCSTTAFTGCQNTPKQQQQQQQQQHHPCSRSTQNYKASSACERSNSSSTKDVNTPFLVVGKYKACTEKDIDALHCSAAVTLAGTGAAAAASSSTADELTTETHHPTTSAAAAGVEQQHTRFSAANLKRSVCLCDCSSSSRCSSSRCSRYKRNQGKTCCCCSILEKDKGEAAAGTLRKPVVYNKPGLRGESTTYISPSPGDTAACSRCSSTDTRRSSSTDSSRGRNSTSSRSSRRKSSSTDSSRRRSSNTHSSRRRRRSSNTDSSRSSSCDSRGGNNNNRQGDSENSGDRSSCSGSRNRDCCSMNHMNNGSRNSDRCISTGRKNSSKWKKDINQYRGEAAGFTCQQGYSSTEEEKTKGNTVAAASRVQKQHISARDTMEKSCARKAHAAEQPYAVKQQTVAAANKEEEEAAAATGADNIRRGAEEHNAVTNAVGNDSFAGAAAAEAVGSSHIAAAAAKPPLIHDSTAAVAAKAVDNDLLDAAGTAADGPCGISTEGSTRSGREMLKDEAGGVLKETAAEEVPIGGGKKTEKERCGWWKEKIKEAGAYSFHSKRSNSSSSTGQHAIVYMQHGLLESSLNWVSGGDGSLAFMLAYEGCDVWLGNNRGNEYTRLLLPPGACCCSRYHTPLDSKRFMHMPQSCSCCCLRRSQCPPAAPHKCNAAAVEGRCNCRIGSCRTAATAAGKTTSAVATGRNTAATATAAGRNTAATATSRSTAAVAADTRMEGEAAEWRTKSTRATPEKVKDRDRICSEASVVTVGEGGAPTRRNTATCGRCCMKKGGRGREIYQGLSGNELEAYLRNELAVLREQMSRHVGGVSRHHVPTQEQQQIYEEKKRQQQHSSKEDVITAHRALAKSAKEENTTAATATAQTENNNNNNMNINSAQQQLCEAHWRRRVKRTYGNLCCSALCCHCTGLTSLPEFEKNVSLQLQRQQLSQACLDAFAVLLLLLGRGDSRRSLQKRREKDARQQLLQQEEDQAVQQNKKTPKRKKMQQEQQRASGYEEGTEETHGQCTGGQQHQEKNDDEEQRHQQQQMGDGRTTSREQEKFDVLLSEKAHAQEQQRQRDIEPGNKLVGGVLPEEKEDEFSRTSWKTDKKCNCEMGSRLIADSEQKVDNTCGTAVIIDALDAVTGGVEIHRRNSRCKQADGQQQHQHQIQYKSVQEGKQQQMAEVLGRTENDLEAAIMDEENLSSCSSVEEDEVPPFTNALRSATGQQWTYYHMAAYDVPAILDYILSLRQEEATEKRRGRERTAIRRRRRTASACTGVESATDSAVQKQIRGNLSYSTTAGSCAQQLLSSSKQSHGDVSRSVAVVKAQQQKQHVTVQQQTQQEEKQQKEEEQQQSYVESKSCTGLEYEEVEEDTQVEESEIEEKDDSFLGSIWAVGQSQGAAQLLAMLALYPALGLLFRGVVLFSPPVVLHGPGSLSVSARMFINLALRMPEAVLLSIRAAEQLLPVPVLSLLGDFVAGRKLMGFYTGYIGWQQRCINFRFTPSGGTSKRNFDLWVGSMARASNSIVNDSRRSSRSNSSQNNNSQRRTSLTYNEKAALATTSEAPAGAVASVPTHAAEETVPATAAERRLGEGHDRKEYLETDAEAKIGKGSAASYPLERICCPVFALLGGKDNLVDADASSNHLSRCLKRTQLLHVEIWKESGHLDFGWTQARRVDLYPRLLRLLLSPKDSEELQKHCLWQLQQQQ